MTLENTLQERGARYGAFSEHAQIAQSIQDGYRIYPEKWNKLPPVVKQGLTTIADKIARILNGDEYYDDNYHDLGGYAKLMEDWVRKENERKSSIVAAPISAAGPIPPVNSIINIGNSQIQKC
jgi:hypothetical protein